MSSVSSPDFRAPSGSMSGFGDMLDERLLRERIIWLEGEVRDENSDRIAKQLQVLAAEDHERDISLYINSPGGSSEAIRVFLARGLESLPAGRPHTGEAEEAHLPQAWVPLAEAVDLVLHGRVGSPSAVAGILALAALPSRDEGDLRPANDPWGARAWLEANSRVRRV